MGLPARILAACTLALLLTSAFAPTAEALSSYTVEDCRPRVQYTVTAGALSGPFSFPCIIANAADLVVELNSVVQTLTAAYTVSINTPPAVGGSVSLVSAATAGDIVTIYRVTDIVRGTDWTQPQALYGYQLDAELDAIVTMLQDLELKLERAVRYDEAFGGDPFDSTLPAADTAKVLGWLGTGKIGNVDPGAVGLGAAAFNATVPGGGRTVSTLADYLANNGGGYFNPMDFGAVCDEATDDATAFQAAIDAAEAYNTPVAGFGGATVVLPCKHCVIGSGLTVELNKHLRFAGCGIEQSKVEYTGAAGAALTITGTATGENTGLHMEGFQIVNTGSGTDGIYIGWASFSPVFERVMVGGFSNAQFKCNAACENAKWLWTRTELADDGGSTGKYGIYSANTNGNLVLGHQHHRGGSYNGTNGSYGIYFDNVDGGAIIGAVVEGGTPPEVLDVGIAIVESAPRATPAGAIVIEGSYIERAKICYQFDGISGGAVKSPTIIGGKCGSSTQVGIDLVEYVDAPRISATRIQVTHSAAEPNAERLIRVGSAVTDMQVDHLETDCTGGGLTTLGADPLATVNTDQTVTVTHTAHPYSTGDHVFIGGVSAACNGIPATDITAPNSTPNAQYHTITKIDADSYSFEAATAATSTGTCGGAGVQPNACIPWVEYDDSFPPKKWAMVYPHAEPIEIATRTDATGNSGNTNHIVATLSGDYRRPIAALVDVCITVDIVGDDSQRTHVKLLPKGGSEDETDYFMVTRNMVSHHELGTDPLAMVDTDATVTVTDTDHDYQTGDVAYISGATGTINGIPAANINGERTVTKIDVNSYSIEADSAATATASGGGTTIRSTFQTTFCQDFLVPLDSNGELTWQSWIDTGWQADHDIDEKAVVF